MTTAAPPTPATPAAPTPGSAARARASLTNTLAVLAAVLVASLALATWLGEETLPWATVCDVRMPRVVLMALTGGALAVCGVTLQATFQNPLADPGVLGISSGGALGAVIAICTGVAGGDALSLPAFAFVGAFGTSLVVYAIAHVGARPSTATLLLTGVAVGQLASALVSLLLIWSDEYRLRVVLFWMLGGAEGRAWQHVQLALGPILIGALLLGVRHRHIDALSMGEEHALSIGLPVVSSRLFLLAVCSLVAGTAVSVTGAVAFVGLIVPHIVRLLVGPVARRLLPAAFLGGATFLVLCDLCVRLLARAHVWTQLGVLTSALGVPFFLSLLRRSRRLQR